MERINQRTVNVKVTRHELCDLCIALTTVANAEGAGEHWKALREKLRAQLADFDAKIIEENK